MKIKLTLLLSALFLLASCEGKDKEQHVASTANELNTLRSVNMSYFLEGAIVGDIETVNCTLSGGTKTQCYRFTVVGAPVDSDTSPEGPFVRRRLTLLLTKEALGSMVKEVCIK